VASQPGIPRRPAPTGKQPYAITWQDVQPMAFAAKQREPGDEVPVRTWRGLIKKS
jgi:hypothetical protein